MAVVEVRLAAVELAGGRVGGLLIPPPAALVRVELAVGFVAVDEVVAGRRVAVVVVPGAGFFAAVALPTGLVPFAAAGFLTGAGWAFSAAAAAGAAAGAASGEAGWGFSAGASSCWTTSKPSASDMLAYRRASFQLQRDGGAGSYLVMEQRLAAWPPQIQGAWPVEPFAKASQH